MGLPSIDTRLGRLPLFRRPMANLSHARAVDGLLSRQHCVASPAGGNMKLFIAAIAVATLTAAGAAHAVDGAARAMPPPEEVSPAPYNWTGPFFGVSVGVAVG